MGRETYQSCSYLRKRKIRYTWGIGMFYRNLWSPKARWGQEEKLGKLEIIRTFNVFAETEVFIWNKQSYCH